MRSKGAKFLKQDEQNNKSRVLSAFNIFIKKRRLEMTAAELEHMSGPIATAKFAGEWKALTDK